MHKMKHIVSFILLVCIGFSCAGTTPSAQVVECCRSSVYPVNKVWISKEGSKINYNFYDTYGLITKITAYEIDESGNIVPAKTLEVNETAMSCPVGHRTTNPIHADLLKSNDSRILCINKDNKLKPNKWYGVCRDRTCRSCHLDRMAATDVDPQYLTIKSSEVRGSSLIIEFNVKNPGVLYNVSMEIGVARDTLIEFTMGATQSTHTIQVPNVSDNVFRYPIYVFVDPYVTASFVCQVNGKRQVTVLPPFTRSVS